MGHAQLSLPLSWGAGCLQKTVAVLCPSSSIKLIFSGAWSILGTVLGFWGYNSEQNRRRSLSHEMYKLQTINITSEYTISYI